MSPDTFSELSKLLRKHAKRLELHKSVIGSKAKVAKPSLHLYGKRSVAIGNRKPQQTYLAGIIEQKHFTGLYFMPIYSHPTSFAIEDQELRKSMKGKSCFNLRVLTPAMLRELDDMLKRGIALYRTEGWI